MQDRLRYQIWNEKTQTMENRAIPYKNVRFCTGLKDIAGKLIYEEDIVKVVTENNRTLYSVENHTNAKFGNIYRIFFDKDYLSWGFTQINRLENRSYPEFLSIGAIDDGKFKIIGNIYKNPELVKK